MCLVRLPFVRKQHNILAIVRKKNPTIVTRIHATQGTKSLRKFPTEKSLQTKSLFYRANPLSINRNGNMTNMTVSEL